MFVRKPLCCRPWGLCHLDHTAPYILDQRGYASVNGQYIFQCIPKPRQMVWEEVTSFLKQASHRDGTCCHKPGLLTIAHHE
jgi:hypothetical protein